MADDAHAWKIVFVDDDALALDVICRIARQGLPHAQISGLTTSATLLEQGDIDRYDCVILDYDLPECDGMTCARALRERFPHLAIVLCTGNGDEVLAAQAIQCGVSDYIPKSRISVEALTRTITNAITLAERTRIIDEQRADIETFAFALAHDFKQPVRQIMTFCQMIADNIASGQNEETPKLLHFVINAADRLDRLVEVMSEFSLLNRSPDINDLDVGQTIADALESIRRYIDERGAVVTVDGALRVRGNADLLALSIQNIVINGIKYNRSPCPAISLSLTEHQGEGVIAISDNGIGIEEQYLDYIFQPLVRLHGKAEYEGTGLGLTLCRKAIMAQAGNISCSSRVEQGTEFRISLPLVQSRDTLLAQVA
ncbi:MAG: ATP-binding protein [Sphingobium sp.]|nr:response regulator [Sphingobium sp.]MCP5399703.1 response regulator [Sphingomonas sp.]